MRKILTCLTIFAVPVALLSATYDVTVETQVGGRTEDRFNLTMEPGVKDWKGFDARLLAKRYRANGYPHRILERINEELAHEEEVAAENLKKPLELAREKLDAFKRQLSAAEKRIEQNKMSSETLNDKIAILEDVVSRGEKNTSAGAAAYDAYLKKYEPNAESDANYEKLMKRRPKDSGDVEEIDVGSYCDILITKANDKAVAMDLNYAYSRQISQFYSDGNNNKNTITKFPIFERFEKLGAKNVVIPINKTYCFQFGRPTPEQAKSLQEVLDSSTLFSGGVSGASKTNTIAAKIELPKQPSTPLDDEGLLTEIKKKYPDDAGKTIRVLITVKQAK